MLSAPILFVLDLVILSFVYFLFVTVWLSLPVHSIVWKDSSLRIDLLYVEWDTKAYTLTHSCLLNNILVHLRVSMC